MALALGGGAAYADTHGQLFSDHAYDAMSDFYASDLLGMRVYATQTDAAATADPATETSANTEGSTAGNQTADNTGAAAPADPTAEWSNIGEINDLIVTQDGELAAVIIGVGGFLGIGEKDVAVDMSQIEVVSDDGGARFLTVNASPEMLTEAPAYERDGAVAGDGERAAKTSTTADANTEMATNDAAKNREPLVAPDVKRDGYEAAAATDFSAEELQGAPVYGANDEEIGEIGEVMLSADGKAERVVVDVGGFLGIGEKNVALTFDELRLMREVDGDDLRVYIDSSKKALEAQPDYKREG